MTDSYVQQGTLYVIATPIGNLEDITYRAVRVLGGVDLIAAEDTRKTKILLNRYDIQTPQTSYFEHNERKKTPALIRMLGQGTRIGLVSEAGTPAISDPGFRLIAQARAQGIPVVSIPGCCAAVAALSVSALPVHRFAFEGFPPPKAGRRRTFIASLAEEERTLVFYESPHRICATLADMAELWGDRQAMLVRELTKQFEETVSGTLTSILESFSGRTVKGEITLVVHGAERKKPRSRR